MMEFHVVSTLPDALDGLTLWCRRDYLEAEFERLDRGIPKGQISFYFVKCGGAADVEHFRREIDALFANSLDPTKTQDEKAFMNEYISQQFDLPKNLRILSIITILVAILAAANTMSMNFRDRIGEFATMKSLGFGGSLVFGLVQAESLLLCVLGGLAGALGPYIAFTHTPLRNFTVPLIQALEVKPEVCVQAILISLGIGVLAAAWPSWLAIRMPVVSALRDLG
jgi:putative ABC transport system permease protein